ncbi:hypothetical protein [Rubrolithibacter danxiaensis]|uniref:hypothetical protein n=1 Tax=Rubrolithibacter danxiaensis TaxID=3390805 RepID=UPI003BF7C037
MEITNLKEPGWYIARDNKSLWWNLFVYITSKPPFQCIKIEGNSSKTITVFPEEIKEVSDKRISAREFEVIQETSTNTAA